MNRCFSPEGFEASQVNSFDVDQWTFMLDLVFRKIL